jgi:CRISPR/Cas system-associated exonuclease Cas4 (RecB family)
MATVKWSFSGLKQYLNCPRQYHEVKVLRNFEIKETEQIRYGKEVHTALEDYVRDGTPLAKNYQRFAKFVDPLIEVPGDKYPEFEMALDRDRKPCAFDNPDYWVRGIADLVIVNNDTAFIVDYKTGSARYPDPKQLKLMALMIFTFFPQVNRIKGALFFIAHDAMVFDAYDREDIPKLWAVFDPLIIRLNAAYQNNLWPANPTPLCGWCPVKVCEFHKER